jgi:hypothetical protein
MEFPASEQCMSSDERSQERGFKVADRRRFSETGEARDTDENAASERSAAETSTESQPTPAEGPAATAHAQEGAPEAEINFSTFIIGLSAQALAHLGEIPDPMYQSVRVDLEAARQVIDILGLLRDKTKGNLDNAEGPLLESVLYDLRMKYVERARGS